MNNNSNNKINSILKQPELNDSKENITEMSTAVALLKNLKKINKEDYSKNEAENERKKKRNKDDGPNYDLLTWSKEKDKKPVRTRWMLIGFGQSIEVKLDEEGDNHSIDTQIDKMDSEKNLDTFYDPICNLGIGKKGGLIQYLRNVGEESLLLPSHQFDGQTNTLGRAVRLSNYELD